MPISKKFRAFELVGRRVKADIELRTQGGTAVASGAVLVIVDASRNLTLRMDTCPHCGQSFFIRGVPRSEVTLLEPEDVGEFHPVTVTVALDELLRVRNELRSAVLGCSFIPVEELLFKTANSVVNTLDRWLEDQKRSLSLKEEKS